MATRNLQTSREEREPKDRAIMVHMGTLHRQLAQFWAHRSHSDFIYVLFFLGRGHPPTRREGQGTKHYSSITALLS